QLRRSDVARPSQRCDGDDPERRGGRQDGMRDPARVEADRPGPEGDAGPRVHPVVRTHRGRPREPLPRVARRQHQQLRRDQTAVRREAHGPGEVRGALPPGPGLRRPDPDDDGRRHLPDEGEGSRRGREAPRLRVLRWTMPVAGLLEQTVEIPGGVEVGLDGDAIVVSAKGTTLRRKLSHPRIQIVVQGKQAKVRCEYPRRREGALVGTFAAHLRNMIVGVTEGYAYEMKIVYSHFPVKATVKGPEFIIENFLGEKFPRKTRIVGETKVELGAWSDRYELSTEGKVDDLRKRLLGFVAKEEARAAREVETTEPPEEKKKPAEKEEPEEEKPLRKKPKKPKEKEEVEERVHEARAKPKLDDRLKQLLALRSAKNAARPKFRRQEWFRYRMFGDEWRKPQGGQSKLRRHFGYRWNLPSIGYRGPRAVRGLHPSGFQEILVHNERQLEGLDGTKQAVRIAHGVGTRK